jgi:signal transduction histidine kinase
VTRTSLAARITAASVAVALLAALVAALATARLLDRDDRAQARAALAAQADLAALAVTDERASALRAALAGHGVEVVTVGANGRLAGEDRAVAAARRAGLGREAGASGGGPDGPVSRVVLDQRRPTFVEARPVPRSTDGASVGPVAIALVERWSPGVGVSVARAVALASAIALAGAALAGALLSGALSRPLRRAADVAHRMREGRRDLRVPVEGPAEVAEVAESLNELADALAHSEDRQRAFLHAVSHELRTPLTAVTGFAESIADGVTTGEDARRAGATILAEAGRLEHLVGDLLDLARLGADDFALDLADLDLVPLVAEAGEVWRARGERAGLVVRVETPLHPVPARTDPRRLRQAVDALADNAVRVTPAGRPLVVALSAAPGQAVLEVRDGGPGLAPEDYAVAFERGVLHARHAERAGSSGLGLSLVAGLVERLGGRVAAAPAPEGGAAFRIELPVAGPPPRGPAPRSTGRAAQASG